MDVPTAAGSAVAATRSGRAENAMILTENCILMFGVFEVLVGSEERG